MKRKEGMSILYSQILRTRATVIALTEKRIEIFYTRADEPVFVFSPDGREA